MLTGEETLGAALKLNLSLINEDQRPVQEELERVHVTFSEAIVKMVAQSREIREKPPQQYRKEEAE